MILSFSITRSGNVPSMKNKLSALDQPFNFFCTKRLYEKLAPNKNLKRCFIRVPYMAMEIFKEFFEEKIIEIKMSRDSFETVGN